jgi:hypothetical protein
MRFHPTLALLPMLALAGCTARTQGSRIGVPGKGTVRLLSKCVKSDPGVVQWLWTIVGDRNWTTVSRNGDTFRLSNSYPLNSLNRSGGTHVWEFTLTARSKTPASNTVAAKLEMKLRGSNSTAVQMEGPIDPRGSKLNDYVKAEKTGDDVVHVPAEIGIAAIGDRKVILAIDN